METTRTGADCCCVCLGCGGLRRMGLMLGEVEALDELAADCVEDKANSRWSRSGFPKRFAGRAASD